MKKIEFVKRFTMIFVAFMLLIACGCGGNNNEKPTDMPATAEPTPEPQKTTQEILDSLGSIEFTEAKNVILFIGDGMGVNHIDATKEILGGQYNDKLAIEYLYNQGTAVTICVDGEPDSASGGTALSTGYKPRYCASFPDFGRADRKSDPGTGF